MPAGSKATAGNQEHNDGRVRANKTRRSASNPLDGGESSRNDDLGSEPQRLLGARYCSKGRPFQSRRCHGQILVRVSLRR